MGVVGIVTPRLALRLRSSWVGILVGLVFVALAAVFTADSVMNMLCRSMRWYNSQRQAIFQPVDPASPPCGMLIQWDVFGEVNRTPRGGRITIVLDPTTPFGGVMVGVVPSVGRVHAEIDVRDGRFVIRDTSGERVREGRPFDAEATGDMLSLAGMPLEADDLAVLADQVTRLVDHTTPLKPSMALTPGKQILYSGASGASSDLSLPFALLGAWGSTAMHRLSIGFGVVVLVLATIMVAWCRRRILRAGHA